MSAFAVTLCILASVSFTAVATFSLLMYAFKTAFREEDHCQLCVGLIARCFIERDATPPNVLCDRCASLHRQRRN
jgi:hypothetical protein